MTRTKQTRLKRPSTEDKEKSDDSMEKDEPVPIKMPKQAKATELKHPQVARLFDLNRRTILVKKLLLDCKERSKNYRRQILEHLQPLPSDDRSPNFTYKTVKNDGNSLYRSLSYLLFNDESYHSHIRQAIFASMYEHRELLDKVCPDLTFGSYQTVDSYIRETRADQFGRLPNGLVEIEAAALYFNVPIFLYTRPIDVKLTVFHLTKKFDDERGFVLFNFYGYFRPVLTFDGENRDHRELSRNENVVALQAKNGYTLHIGINELNAISTSLCDKVITKSPFNTRLEEGSLEAIEKFTKLQFRQWNLSVDLFNFCCRHQCFPLIEATIKHFKSLTDIGEELTCIDFIEGLEDASKMYKAELTEHFRDMCFNISDDRLFALNPKTDFLKNVVNQVILQKMTYVCSTESVSVNTADGELAYTDLFPFTVICMDSETKQVMYYPGPKPNGQGWIYLDLNRRLMEALDQIYHPDNVLFSKSTIYFCTMSDKGEYFIGVIKNVFQYHQHLNYRKLPKPRKKITLVHLVNSDHGQPLLVDKESKQAYNLFSDTWLPVEDMIKCDETPYYEIRVITTKTKKSDVMEDQKQKVILRKPISKSLFGYPSVRYSPMHQPKIPFRYTLNSAVKELTVTTRLGNHNITLNPDKRFEEDQKLLYGERKIDVHYAVPKPRGAYLTFALFETKCLNEVLARKRLVDRSIDTIDFFVKNTDPEKLDEMCRYYLRFPIKALIKLLHKTSDIDEVLRTVVSEWYPVARKHCKLSTTVTPEMLLGWAYKEIVQRALYEKFIPKVEDRRTIYENDMLMRSVVSEDILAELEEKYSRSDIDSVD